MPCAQSPSAEGSDFHGLQYSFRDFEVLMLQNKGVEDV